MKIKMYSADWCSDCRVAKNFLDEHNIAYELIDVSKDALAADYVRSVNGVKESYQHLISTEKYILILEFKN